MSNSDQQAIIRVEGLTHRYGDFTAVDNISFEVHEGEIFSLLGPNGAGKTTTINILITLLHQTEGRCFVDGIDVARHPNRVRERIGIVFQEEVLDKDLTVFETMEFHGKLYDIHRAERHARIDELLGVVELEGKRSSLVKDLSGGMKRRLEIARGLMTRPRVLFLDEPTIGLDPQTRLRIWEYIRAINEQGITVFLTTHYMDEADMLSDRIKIMDYGRIIAKGSPDELKNSLGKDILILCIEDGEDGARRVRSSLERHPAVSNVLERDGKVELMLSQPGGPLVSPFLKELGSLDPPIGVCDLQLKRPTLDDVFVYYTGRELREQGPERPGNVRRRRMRGH